ncbi:MAG: PAS domain S-box protein [Ignavibacteriaceae bacterium]|jgi:PAS domain S-box-containing protein
MGNYMNSENNLVTILIAEDSATQAEKLKFLLEKQNYKVILAKDGKEAFGFIVKDKPSLVISDIIMPEMNGYELCKEIKAGESTMDIPVILLTSLTRSEDVLEGISCGADNFITKPYREDYLISHIEQILANRKIYKNERVRVGVEILFGGKRRFITSSQQQMLSLLISTYEAAVQRNDELVQTQEELKKLNEHLEEVVTERTAELLAEVEIRKRAEDRIIKLNRVYAVLSNINQAIVRIHDTKQLLNKACLIAIDEGKFQSAWIGIVNSETKKIETVATAGLANSLIEVSSKQNPIINAIKLGKSFFSNNIDTDNNIPEILKQHSPSLGFKSFVVFPLIVLGKAIGGYCICSNEVNFFDEIELNLLDEMSTDISFALEYIQKEFERKRAEEALLKLKKAVDNSGEIIFLTDNEGIFTFINPAFTSIYGFTSDEIVGKVTPRILKGGLEEANDYKLFWETLKEGKEKRGELINKRKDGTLINVEVSASPIFDETKNIIGFLGIQRDITERKKAEEALMESELRFKQVSENALEWIWEIDINGLYTYASPIIKELLGYEAEELVGIKYFYDFFDPEIKEEMKQAAIAAFALKQSFRNFINCNIHKDGRKIILSTTGIPIFDKKNNLMGYRGVDVDITERKRAEEEIAMLAHSLRSVNECVSITDMEDKILFVNESFLKTYGYSENELVGKHMSIARSPNNPAELVGEILPATIHGGWQGELWNKRKDGSEFPISLSTTVINDKGGKPLGLIGVAHDITERKRAEKELIESKEKAESANKLKDAFINNMSHEIRTPLNGILGLASIIKENYAKYVEKEDESLFTGIDSSAQRIIRTVDMILNYSRLQTGEYSVILKEINLPEICEHIINQNKDAAEKKNLELLFDNRCGETKIIGDEYSITQAISNLIDNAVKYTQKGFVTISLLDKSDDALILEIKDSGIGISHEYLEHLFEPYRQEEMGYGRSYEGVGLGLALTKKYFELNKAVLSVESKKGEGTIFTVTFKKVMKPMGETDIPKKITTKVEPENGEKKRLVLLVEDDYINQVTTKRFLQNGYNILMTDSSDEALNILKENKVDIILMDISIGGSRDGLELTKELKASKEYQHIPIIAVTAHAFDKDRQNALAAGCDTYLSKPFTKVSLLEMIANLI